jgi:hypothetical protein
VIGRWGYPLAIFHHRKSLRETADGNELRALHGDAALQELFKITQAEVRAFPGTIGEAIGMTYWDGKETWVMTEQGWQRQETQAGFQ